MSRRSSSSLCESLLDQFRIPVTDQCVTRRALEDIAGKIEKIGKKKLWKRILKRNKYADKIEQQKTHLRNALLMFQVRSIFSLTLMTSQCGNLAERSCSKIRTSSYRCVRPTVRLSAIMWNWEVCSASRWTSLLGLSSRRFFFPWESALMRVGNFWEPLTITPSVGSTVSNRIRTVFHVQYTPHFTWYPYGIIYLFELKY